MSEITFIEKEPVWDDSPFTGGCYLYPNFMVKDGRELFMFNRREPDDSWKQRENEERKQQLLSTGGAYLRFNGFYNDPIRMLGEIAERKHHFTEPNNLHYCSFEKNGFKDFHGNRVEVSAAFFYRIYDEELANRIDRIAELIKKEKWDAALMEVHQNE